MKLRGPFTVPAGHVLDSLRFRDQRNRAITRAVRKEDRALSRLPFALWLLSVFMAAPGASVRLAAPKILRAEVNSTVNATTEGPVEPVGMMAGMILDSVTPMSFGETAIPRGRMYAECWIVDGGGQEVGCVWRGYLQTSGGAIAGVSSSPGMVMYPGYGIRAVVTQTGRGSSNTKVGFSCSLTNILREGGYIHSVEPGEGRGELVTFSLSNPAAGADFADTTVPAKCLWRVHQMSGALTASAVASNRLVTTAHVDGGLAVGTGTTPQPVTASQTAGVDLIRGGTESSNAASGRVQGGLVDKQIAAGVIVRWQTPNRDAGDQWSSGRMSVEEWAVP